jgi:hypothetical protein
MTSTTSRHVVGKTVLITGANCGIGLWTARGLAALGAQIVMFCRDPARGDAARLELAGFDDLPLPRSRSTAGFCGPAGIGRQPGPGTDALQARSVSICNSPLVMCPLRWGRPSPWPGSTTVGPGSPPGPGSTTVGPGSPPGRAPPRWGLALPPGRPSSPRHERARAHRPRCWLRARDGQ